MYLYITPNDVDRICNDLMFYVTVYSNFEELKDFSEEQIKAALDDVCDIYYGHNLSLEGIAEKVIEILTDE